MSYVKTSWVARVGTALNRFLKTNETSTEVELTNDPTGVSVQGTPFTVANMNKIEEGIYDNSVAIENNIDQGVKTTDSPTFVDTNTKINGAQWYPGGAKKQINIANTNATEDYWYDALVGYFPSAGLTINANGYLKNSIGTVLIVFNLVRGSTYVRAEGIKLDGTATIFTLNNGGAGTYTGSLTL